MKKISRFKRAFTLIELTVVIATTSILMIGFTGFTIFFNNQYNYEMYLQNTINSANYMKYAIANNVERYNYSYETGIDFKINSSTNKVDNTLLFTAVLPSYTSETNETIASASIKEYFFKEVSGGNSYFGYNEYVYTFNNLTIPDKTTPIQVIRTAITTMTKPTPTEFIVYEAKSFMKLEVSDVTSAELLAQNSNLKEYRFDIHYDFETEMAQAGKSIMTFNKYVYYIQ